MKYEVSILGQSVGFDGPDTAEQFDALTSPGQCVKLAMRDIMYRPVASPFRKAFIATIVALTGIARLQTGTKKQGKNTVPVIETEEVYFERLKESKPGGTTKEGAALTWNEVVTAANKAGYEAVGSIDEVIKKAGQGRSDVAQQYVDKAEELVAKWASGESTKERFEERVRGVLGDDWEGLPEDPSITDVARAVKAFFTSGL